MPTDKSNPRGHLVAIGGAEDKDSELEVLSRVISLAPRNNKKVLIVATASGVPDEVFSAYRAAFERLGASEIGALDVRSRQQAADPANVQEVKRYGIVFFTGGDQLRLTHVYGGSAVLEAIRERYVAGAVIAGTSAGAVALSATMIYNGAAADALRKGAVNMTTGFGLVEGVIIDSHFLERGRFTRLMEVAATNPEYLGVGLGEDAGVVVHPNRIVEAVGPGHVIVLDSSHLGSSNVAEIGTDEPVALENVIMHAMISGYGFDLDRRTYMNPEQLNERLGRQA